MEKHKNALIGGLLAIVFVMAVGYAAFAQTLTVNGTASYNVNGFNVYISNATNANSVDNTLLPKGVSITPTDFTSSVTGFNNDGADIAVNLNANFNYIGEIATFTITVKNDSSKAVNLTSLNQTWSAGADDYVTWTVNGIAQSDTIAASGTKTFTVVAKTVKAYTSQTPLNVDNTVSLTFTEAA